MKKSQYIKKILQRKNSICFLFSKSNRCNIKYCINQKLKISYKVCKTNYIFTLIKKLDSFIIFTARFVFYLSTLKQILFNFNQCVSSMIYLVVRINNASKTTDNNQRNSTKYTAMGKRCGRQWPFALGQSDGYK